MINVIIAEDDFRVAKIHEAYMEKIEGMCVVGRAMNASDTLDLLSEQSVDLLLLDVYMPDMLGTDLLQEIRKVHSSLDIIMITASTEKIFLEKSLRYGVFQYLIKPVELNKFKQTMSQYKKNRQLLRKTKEVNEKLLESIFGNDSSLISQQNLPPGIDGITLDKVIQIVLSECGGMTSEKVGEKMGASRTTARRYLEYLVGIDYLKTESVYGIVGRPERRYFLKETHTGNL
ncbi:response regulator [Oceanobacillus massiliensis]|uniref:response regulator n=1 Tax=Oceanobacillus massiliensis TaxID=1465765 RepID=UPI000287C7E8|nr:response regulator [Oceanobacillus massiliensis]